MKDWLWIESDSLAKFCLIALRLQSMKSILINFSSVKILRLLGIASGTRVELKWTMFLASS